MRVFQAKGILKFTDKIGQVAEGIAQLTLAPGVPSGKVGRRYPQSRCEFADIGQPRVRAKRDRDAVQQYYGRALAGFQVAGPPVAEVEALVATGCVPHVHRPSARVPGRMQDII